MTDAWHIPADQLDGYLGGDVDQPTASSVEAHLVRCGQCRNALAERSDAVVIRDSWTSIERVIDGEFASPVERAARWAGLGDREVRTLAPTLSLQIAWLGASLLALLAAAVLARRTGAPEDGLARVVFMTMAPLAPLAAVVAALSTASEPAPEIARATPASRLRIGAVRAATVVVAAITIGLLASAVLPGSWIEAVVWLLPALALSALGALISRRVAPMSAIGWLGAGWVVTVVVTARLTDDRLGAFRPGAQVVYVSVAVIGAAAIALRPDSLDLRSPS